LILIGVFINARFESVDPIPGIAAGRC
jgi:hypothetical protein